MDAQEGSNFSDGIYFNAYVYDEPFLLYPEQFPLTCSEGLPLDHTGMTIGLSSGITTWLEAQRLPATLPSELDTFEIRQIKFSASFGPKPCPPYDPFCFPDYNTLNILADIDGTAHDAGQMISKLTDTVLTINSNKGILNFLDAKLSSVKEALDDVNEKKDGSAIRELQAFINAVEAQRGNHITDADADALIAAAQCIIYALGMQ